MIYKAIYALLSSVESDTYPGSVPQAVAMPFINHYKASVSEVQCKDGPQGIYAGTYQVNIVAITKEACITLANAVRAALDGQAGTIGGIVVDFIRYNQESDHWDGEALCHIIAQQYDIRYR